MRYLAIMAAIAIGGPIAGDGAAVHGETLPVVNGTFDDLGGLAEGGGGWFGGVPKGWRGSDNRYAVHTERGETPPICNVSTLGFLRQEVATLERTSNVALTFDVAEAWSTGAVMRAQILDRDLLELAVGEFGAGKGHRLEATNVPKGTPVIIGFRATKGTPGLDNVSVYAARASSAPATGPADRRDAGDITVACYYFGNYHTGDRRNEASKGRGWSEWELVKAARPRFPGHQQPKVPLWGYTDE